MAAERTTKKRAQRIDLNYFKRPHPFRRWRLWLSIAVPLLAIAWIAWHGLRGNQRVYSAGKMSEAHAVLAAKCDACHFEMAGFFSQKTSDRACLACHDGPIHHDDEVFTPKCASCHEEHRGVMQLAKTSDAVCTQCHDNLRVTSGPVKYVRDIENFGSGHPEFAALRAGAADPGTIKLNHAVHMKKNLKGPDGQPVQLDCDDCHRPANSTEAWRFAAPAPPVAMPGAPGSTVNAAMAAMPPSQKSDLPAMVLARAYMAPPTYTKACAACHGLQFDKRFTEGAPHDTPEVIHAFLVQKFAQYIAAHPAEAREIVPVPGLPQRPQPVAVRVLTPPEWVAEHVGQAEQLLYGKTCKQCHALSFSSGGAGGAALPTVAKSNITPRWMPHANFNHARHQLVACTECHAALTSHETSDILLPGITTCEKCHHSGADGAEARCFECHTYHDWTKAKAVKGKLTLTGLGE